ncbi:MAG TPA: FapA family protein [bacterium]|nr:FapA family protein [bacterium]HPN94305.1 FapA family protein [bacterium]
MKVKLLKKMQEAALQFDPPSVPPRQRKWRVDCSIKENGMIAYARVVAADDKCDATEYDILARIYREGARLGINLERVREMAVKKRFNEDVVVAVGIEPEPGADAAIYPKMDFKEFTPKEIIEKFPGQPFYKGELVEAEQVLLEKSPASPGIPGFTVRGQMIAATPGKDVFFDVGPNVRVSEDGRSAVAEISGMAGLVKGTIEIREPQYDEWKYNISFKNKNMEAHLAIVPGMSRQPAHDREWFEDLLRRNDIKFGAVTDAWKLIPTTLHSTYSIVAARGERPVPGDAARIDEKFELSASSGVFYVKSGQLIAEKKPPGKGIKGRDVFDKPIDAPDGSDTELSAGTNTHLSEDGLKLFAGYDGCVVKRKGVYSVAKVVSIEGGNGSVRKQARHEEAVKVVGSLTAGHEIVSGAHVDITGDVESCDIIAGATLRVAGHVRNCMENRIQCAGDLVLGSAERSRFVAGGGVYFSGELRNCEVYSGGSLSCNGTNKGTLAGCNVVVAGSADLCNLGSDNGSACVLMVGAAHAARSRQEQLTREIVKLIDSHNLAAAECARIETAVKEKTAIREDAAKLKRLLVARETLLERIRITQAAIAKMKTDMEESAAKAFIRINGTALPGARVRIGPHARTIDSPLKNCLLYYSPLSRAVEIKQF